MSCVANYLLIYPHHCNGTSQIWLYTIHRYVFCLNFQPVAQVTKTWFGEDFTLLISRIAPERPNEYLQQQWFSLILSHIRFVFNSPLSVLRFFVSHAMYHWGRIYWGRLCWFHCHWIERAIFHWMGKDPIALHGSFYYRLLMPNNEANKIREWAITNSKPFCSLWCSLVNGTGVVMVNILSEILKTHAY